MHRSDLYDEGMVIVIDVDIDAGEADDLMELIATLIDIAIAGHESAHFIVFRRKSLGKRSS